MASSTHAGELIELVYPALPLATATATPADRALWKLTEYALEHSAV
jgi:hypothetical protein